MSGARDKTAPRRRRDADRGSPPDVPASVRASEVARLSAFLEAARTSLSICSISGPGGVGKSHLLREALEALPPDSGYLRLTVDGASEVGRTDFFGLIEDGLAPNVLPLPANPDRDYFGQTREVAELYRGLTREAEAEINSSGLPPHIKEAVVALLPLGQLALKVAPTTRVAKLLARVDVADVPPERVVEALDGLRVLHPSAPIWAPVREWMGGAKKHRVARDLFGVTAEALVEDLTAAIVGRNKRKSPPVEGASRLLLVLDDYEALEPLIGGFLVGSFVQKLATAPFPTALIVIGRDPLEATHAGWGQHAKRWLRGDIRLSSFSEKAVFRLLEAARIPKDRWQSLYESTQGFPFVLDAAIREESNPGAASALSARQFFERSIRWMTARQRGWFETVCYLDTINEDTLRRFYSPSEAREVQDWFEHEASIRDPVAREWTVRPYIREKALRYLEMRAPERHREMLATARGGAALLK